MMKSLTILFFLTATPATSAELPDCSNPDNAMAAFQLGLVGDNFGDSSIGDYLVTRAIQSYLGHKSITHTVRYTELLPNRFRSFWKD
jgi:hypothetical protein